MTVAIDESGYDNPVAISNHLSVGVLEADLLPRVNRQDSAAIERDSAVAHRPERRGCDDIFAADNRGHALKNGSARARGGRPQRAATAYTTRVTAYGRANDS